MNYLTILNAIMIDVTVCSFPAYLRKNLGGNWCVEKIILFFLFIQHVPFPPPLCAQ